MKAMPLYDISILSFVYLRSYLCKLRAYVVRALQALVFVLPWHARSLRELHDVGIIFGSQGPRKG